MKKNLGGETFYEKESFQKGRCEKVPTQYETNKKVSILKEEGQSEFGLE